MSTKFTNFKALLNINLHFFIGPLLRKEIFLDYKQLLRNKYTVTAVPANQQAHFLQLFLRGAA